MRSTGCIYSILLMDRGFASENILRFIVRLRRGTSMMVAWNRAK